MKKPLKIKLEEGDKAPDFSAVDQDGKNICLADFRGRFVVLYFYPRDNTPGCTREACAFRDGFLKFKKRKVAVLGVSTDTQKSHAGFARKQRLPFSLLADPEKQIVRAYGVWGPKVFMGVRYQGTHRVTFLINPEGRIQKIWLKVKPDEHADEVLAAVKPEND